MLLVRHGQSEFNAIFNETRVDPGIVDPRLTELGRQQIAATADALADAGIRRLIASPYRRALETAAIIAGRLSLPVTIEPLVRERAAFDCDIGSSPGALAALYPDYRFDHLDDPWWHDFVAAGAAETEAALDARCAMFRQVMAGVPDFRHVAVITHWGFIKAMTGEQVTNGAIVRVGT